VNIVKQYGKNCGQFTTAFSLARAIVAIACPAGGMLAAQKTLRALRLVSASMRKL
jgi:hypothetical protein